MYLPAQVLQVPSAQETVFAAAMLNYAVDVHSYATAKTFSTIDCNIKDNTPHHVTIIVVEIKHVMRILRNKISIQYADNNFSVV